MEQKKTNQASRVTPVLGKPASAALSSQRVTEPKNRKFRPLVPDLS